MPDTGHWAYLEHVSVSGPGDVMLLSDDLMLFAQCCDYARSLPFIADGAKRDRLPWSGDLYWSGKMPIMGLAVIMAIWRILCGYWLPIRRLRDICGQPAILKI